MDTFLLVSWGFVVGACAMYIMHLMNIKKLLQANAGLLASNRNAMRVLSEVENNLRKLSNSLKEIK
jgi:hypothetical protein